MAKSGKRIAVLGATGFTGRLIARELKGHGVEPLLAGRNAEKLRVLADEIDGGEPVVVDVHDKDALDGLAQRAAVVINCVGPFVDYGEPVVRAAIAGGAHYVDTTGEQPFVRAMLVHDTWAKAQKVAVIPALAFEIAVSDCGAALAARGLDEVESVRVTYVTRFHASQGTKRTALRMLQSAGYAFAGGDWIEEAPARHMVFVDVPGPLGTVAAVSFPSAEVITIPRHVAAREVRAYLSVPKIAARILSASGPAITGLSRSPLGAFAARWLGEGTEGPDEATRRHDVFHVVVDASGRRDGEEVRQRVIMRGRDPYGLTAAIARQGALLLAAGESEVSGVLAPAAAFDPQAFLDGLHGERLACEIGPG